MNNQLIENHGARYEAKYKNTYTWNTYLYMYVFLT